MNIAYLWNNYLVHILDVLLVALIFYRILLLIKGTRGLQILLGIVMLALVTVIVSQIVHLKTLSWLLEKFWVAAVIIIVIVFQPELRNALAQLGGEPFKRIFISNELKFIKEMIPAIKELNKSKTGALIVIKQETGLKNFEESGTVIDGKLSKELLLSLFNTKSILHDGAVIIESLKITAAGCILPISENTSISKSLGIRHRAGLGITEVSDAISIMVSEQTGNISLAYEGKLEQDLSPDELQNKLNEISRLKMEKLLIPRTAAVNEDIKQI